MTNIYEQKESVPVFQVEHSTRLTSTELGNLWTTYMNYSAISCFMKHFNQNVEDKDVQAVLAEAQEIANKRVSKVMEIFSREKYPIPIGFSDEDTFIDAPRLYSDVFYMFYMANMVKVGLATNSLFLTTSVREDVREFYHQSCMSTMRLFEKTTNIMLAKGILVRPPYITTSQKVDFVKKQNFLTGWLGEKRPLLALEISSLHYLTLTNFIGKSLLLGFIQVAKREQVRNYLDRGIKIATKVIENCSSFLSQEEIPLAMPWDSMVTESKVAPFSDKLMMFHVSVLNAAGFLNTGAALSTSLRHDVSLTYLRNLSDNLNYAEDGVNIMIDNAWLEEPPRNIDRSEIIGS